MSNSPLGRANWAALLGYATSDTLADLRAEGWEIAQVRRLPNEDVSVFWAVDLWKGEEFANLIVLNDPDVQKLAVTFAIKPLLDAA